MKVVVTFVDPNVLGTLCEATPFKAQELLLYFLRDQNYSAADSLPPGLSDARSIVFVPHRSGKTVSQYNWLTANLPHASILRAEGFSHIDGDPKYDAMSRLCQDPMSSAAITNFANLVGQETLLKAIDNFAAILLLGRVRGGLTDELTAQRAVLGGMIDALDLSLKEDLDDVVDEHGEDFTRLMNVLEAAAGKYC